MSKDTKTLDEELPNISINAEGFEKAMCINFVIMKFLIEQLEKKNKFQVICCYNPEQLTEQAMEKFDERMEHEITRLLNGWGGK